MFNLFLSPAGRITRTWYWLGFFSQAILLIPISFQIVSVFRSHDREALLLQLLAAFAFLVWSSFCITAKRLHDRGRSGGFFLMQLIPVVGFWVVIECGFLEGDARANAYGPPAGPPGASGASAGRSWDVPEADNSAAIDAMIARSIKAKAAPPAPAAAMATPATPGRSPSIAPVFGRRR